MIGITKFEKIADDFIENCLKEYPAMIYSLHDDIEEYMQEEQLNTFKDVLSEYSKNKDEDREIAVEKLDILNKGLYGNTSEIDGNNLLLYVESITEPVIKELTVLVLTSDNVLMRKLDELENAEQEDPIIPNEWIYHKDLEYNKVLEYVREDYDQLRQECEIEDGTDPMT